MMTNEEVAQLYDTLMSIPGMNETVKLDLRISRKQVLLLAQVIERGLKEAQLNPVGVALAASKEEITELLSISGDCLEKAGLTELRKKLVAFQGN